VGGVCGGREGIKIQWVGKGEGGGGSFKGREGDRRVMGERGEG